MNAPLRNTQPDPDLLAASGPPAAARTTGSLPRAVWVGGGLMGLTIAALAVALVTRGNGGAGATAPLAAGQPPTAAAPVVATAPVETAATPAAQPTTQVAPAPVEAAHTSPQTAAPHATAAHAGTTHRNATQTATPSTGAPPTAGTQVAGNDAPVPVDSRPAPPVAPPPPVCTTCGVVESVTPVKVEGQGSGVGAVAGGAIGAVAGSQIAGRNHKTLGAVLGAVGGGLLGNTVEKHSKTTTVYNVGVRMDDGSLRTLQHGTALHPGDKVTLDGNKVRTVGGVPVPQGGGAAALPSQQQQQQQQPQQQQPQQQLPSGGNASGFSPTGR